MKVKDQNGRFHQVTNENTLVTIFRLRVWKYLDHLFHLCYEDAGCPVDYKQNAYFFSKELVEAGQSQRFDELWKWQPNEAEHAAFEQVVKSRPIKKTEADEFTKRLNQIDDKDIWNELGELDS